MCLSPDRILPPLAHLMSALAQDFFQVQISMGQILSTEKEVSFLIFMGQKCISMGVQELFLAQCLWQCWQYWGDHMWARDGTGSIMQGLTPILPVEPKKAYFDVRTKLIFILITPPKGQI